MIDGMVELTDGRRVAFLDRGPRDAPVVVYCHGTPGSRLELLLAEPTIERSAIDVRIVALDRPGYGRSTPVPGRRYTHWAHDMEQTADRLGIGRFSVLGASGGSPFALACASGLEDRIPRAGIVAGIAPPEAPGMDQVIAADPAPLWLVRFPQRCARRRVPLTAQRSAHQAPGRRAG